MFELGTSNHWWKVAKKFPILSNHINTLKPLGYAFVADLVEEHKLNKILEVGHGAGSFLFDLFKTEKELWGLDDVVEDSMVGEGDLEWMRSEYPEVKFIKGLLGDNIKELPDNYFDMVCSVSVIEHIPLNALAGAFEVTFRILKPGGIVCHSYDIYYKQNTKPVFDAYENAGFKWLKERDQ
jgi:ubiquinone/menaquinone biosynthesis C-methylase UbiE